MYLRLLQGQFGTAEFEPGKNFKNRYVLSCADQEAEKRYSVGKMLLLFRISVGGTLNENEHFLYV